MKYGRGRLERGTYVAICGNCDSERCTAEVAIEKARAELIRAGWHVSTNATELLCESCLQRLLRASEGTVT